MKNFKVLILAVLILSAGSYFQTVAAQEKTKAEQEKELKLQQAIEEQKKAMIEKNAAQEEAAIIIRSKNAEIDEALRNIDVQIESAGRGGNSVRVYAPRGSRVNSGETIDFSGPGNYSYFVHTGDDAERTTWDFSKSVKEKSFSKDYSFDVEKTAKSVSMMVNGDCKAGEIRIKIIMPNGKSYSEILIDEYGNLNWRKSFSISDTENQDKTGEWKFQVNSANATGYFKISLQTY